MELFKNLKELNLSDPFLKALKAVNSISISEDVQKHRATLERNSKLAAPMSGVETKSFNIGEMACEWAYPEFPHNKETVIFYAHGGGYNVGGLGYSRILAAKLVHHVGLPVMYFDYRLAPENPYPAAIEDGMLAYDYLLHQGYGAKNIIFAGDSAGGNLVLCLIQKLIAEGRMAPKALLLFSPWTDMTCASDSYETFKENDPILSMEYIKRCKADYAPEGVDFSLPEFSPLFGDFHNFPPTYIQVGKNEILQDDSNKLFKKMKRQGVDVHLRMFKDGWHVFQQMPVPIAVQAMTEVGEFVESVLYF